MIISLINNYYRVNYFTKFILHTACFSILVTLFNAPGNTLEDRNDTPASAAVTAQHEIADVEPALNEDKKWQYIDIYSEEPFGYQ